MSVSIYVKTIYRQLISTDKMIVWSWGAHQWRSIDDKTLQFAVQGWHFTGHVRIVYIEGSDMYTIQFGHFKRGQWLMLEELEEVYFDQMVEIIDNRVEHIPVYQR